MKVHCNRSQYDSRKKCSIIHRVKYIRQFHIVGIGSDFVRDDEQRSLLIKFVRPKEFDPAVMPCEILLSCLSCDVPLAQISYYRCAQCQIMLASIESTSDCFRSDFRFATTETSPDCL